MDITIQKLESYLGQLIDLEAGILNEIVIKKGENAKELEEIVIEAIKSRRKFEQLDREMSIQEEKEEELKNRRETNEIDLKIDSWKEERLEM